MTDSCTTDIQDIEGDKFVLRGTWTSDNTVAEIRTGLNVVEGFKCQHTGNGVVALSPTVLETFPLINAGGVVSIKQTSARAGIWEAWGY